MELVYGIYKKAEEITAIESHPWRCLKSEYMSLWIEADLAYIQSSHF